MVLEQIGKRMNGPMPINAVIEFEGYMKNKVNDKYVLIFSRAPKIVADPKLKIGSPIEYEKREKDGDFDEDKPEKAQELAAIDIAIPQKKVALQPLDNEEADGSTQMNNKDRQLMDCNNPELNPFSVNFGANVENQDTTASASPEKGQSP